MSTPKFTIDPDTFSAEALTAAISALEVKPFATDFLVIGKWTISAHACGYFLKSDSGFRFSFSQESVETLVSVVVEILEGRTSHVTYLSGQGFVRLNGEITPVKVGNVRSANEYFAKAVKKLELNVLCSGNLILDYTRFAALYKAA